MALVSVTARNNTVSVLLINDLGISFASSEIKLLSTYFKFIELVQSNDLLTAVTASTISLSINGGTSYLNVTDATNLLKVESEYEDLIQDASISIVSSSSKCICIETNIGWTIPNTTYTDVPFAVAEYMNDTTVLEWVIGTPTRILIKQAGTYRIGASIFVLNNTNGGTTDLNMAYSYSRVVKNGTTVVQSEDISHTYYHEVQESYDISFADLVAGDYLTLQMYSEAGKSLTLTKAKLNVQKAEGVKGDVGPSGGTTVEVQEAGVSTVINTSVLNFQGNAVDVISGGTGNAIITINQTAQILKYIHLVDTAGNKDLNIASPGMAVAWDTQVLRDVDTFNQSTVTNPSRITVLVNGWYKISYSLSYNLATARTGIKTYIRKNGSTILLPTSSYGYEYVTGNSSNNTTDILVQLVANDYIELVSIRRLIAGTMYTTAGESSITIELIRSL
jgi:hypothetical protein